MVTPPAQVQPRSNSSPAGSRPSRRHFRDGLAGAPEGPIGPAGRMSMAEARVESRIEAGVAHVELARPDRLNAMDGDMFAAIGDALRALGRDPDVRAILLSGRGRHFSAGLDLEYA